MMSRFLQMNAVCVLMVCRPPTYGASAAANPSFVEISRRVRQVDETVQTDRLGEPIAEYRAILTGVARDPYWATFIPLRIAKVQCYQDDFPGATQTLADMVARLKNEQSSEYSDCPAWLKALVSAEWAHAHMAEWRGDFESAALDYERAMDLLRKNLSLIAHGSWQTILSGPSPGYSVDRRLSAPAGIVVREFCRAWAAGDRKRMSALINGEAAASGWALLGWVPPSAAVEPWDTPRLLSFAHFHCPVNPDLRPSTGSLTFVDVDLAIKDGHPPPLSSGRKRFLLTYGQDGRWKIATYYTVPSCRVYATPLPWYLD
jgi:hypothetical protein